MKTPRVAIVDYDIGNLFSVKNACEAVGMNAIITNETSKIRSADALLLPGVGAFGHAIDNLRNLGLDQEIKNFVKTGKYLMGICLGMQLLMSKSEEFGEQTGLNIIGGTCKRFPNSNSRFSKIKVPQITWNSIQTPNNASVFSGGHPLNDIKNKEFMYFVHSYYVIPVSSENILSSTEYYGIEYCSSLIHENVFAFQFHPEKSGQKGISIYNNFKKLIVGN